MSKPILLMILGFLVQYSYAQEGHIYVTNYKVDESYCDMRINDIAFNSNSLMFIANRKGVAMFDGSSWNKVHNIPNNALALAYDTVTSRIYATFSNAIGYIAQNPKGVYEYKKLNSGNSAGKYDQVILSDDFIAFYSEEFIVLLNREDDLITSYNAKELGSFTGIIKHKENIYINIEKKGIFKLLEDKPVKIYGGSKFKESKILFFTRYNNNKILLGTSQNKIYLFDGKKFEQFAEHTEIRDFLKENLLWDGIDLSGKEFIVSTLTGGCVIIDKIYGKILHTINYQTGLPDDEIFAIAKDPNNNIWMAHEQGLSMIGPDLPIRNYSTYPAIYGNFNTVIKKDNKLFAATTVGSFRLGKVKDLKEISVLVKEKVAKPYYYKKKVKKDILGGLFKKNEVVTKKGYKTGYKITEKKEYAVQSIHYKYIKTEGFEEKCREFIKVDNHIFAATNFGLYDITDSVAYALINDVYVNDVHKDIDSTAFYIATLEGVKLLTFRFNDSIISNISIENLFDSHDAPVNSITQDSSGNLIFGSDNQAYFCQQDSAYAFKEPRLLEFPKKIFEPLNIKKISNTIYFVQSAGLFFFDCESKEIKYQDLEYITRGNIEYITGNKDIWVRKDNSWQGIMHKNDTLKNEFFDLFNNIKYIYRDKKDTLWLVSNSDIIKIEPNIHSNIDYKFNVYFTSLQDHSDSLYTLDNAVFEYDNNAIKLEMSAPFYLKPQATQYQYFIKGLKNYDKWSNWSTYNKIELSSMPPGNYTVKVRAKNILGQVTKEETIEIKVLKPFWQTQEFYIIVGILTLLLVALVFYLSHRRLIKKKRVLEQKVKERTAELEEEKNKTERLLLNILPKQTADELKKHNKVTPRNYKDATVLFTDFKGFTKIAEQLTPKQLVDEIDYCFKSFDAIIDKYQIEKIKTIGDAYMCASGLPEQCADNASEVLKAALEIRDFMENYGEERKKAGKPYFEIRIGIHSGKLVAGVVGTKKYAYDIWGDTVNVASRMESSGEPGKVNISGDTYKKLLKLKKDFVFEHRGKIEAKNKGEVDMYFVERNLRA